MKSTRHTRSHINIISNTFHLRGIDEIPWTNNLSDQIIVVFAAAISFETELWGDVDQLLTDLLHFTKRFGLEEMLGGPVWLEIMFAPLLVDV